MKVQVLSDLHLEHGGIVPEHHPAAEVTVLTPDAHGAGSGTDTCSASSGRPGTQIQVPSKACGLKCK